MKSDAWVFANKLLAWGTSPTARATKICSFTHIYCPKLIEKNQTCNFLSWFFIEDQNIDSFTWKLRTRPLFICEFATSWQLRVRIWVRIHFMRNELCFCLNHHLSQYVFLGFQKIEKLMFFGKVPFFCTSVLQKTYFLGNKRISETWNFTNWFFRC